MLVFIFQNVADLLRNGGYSSAFMHTLLMFYAIISILILLNMLIAMMGTTFSDVVAKQGTGWRQYQVHSWNHSYVLPMLLLFVCAVYAGTCEMQ